MAEAVVEELAPYREAYRSLSNGDVRAVLHDGGAKANELAAPYEREVRKAVGIKGY